MKLFVSRDDIMMLGGIMVLFIANERNSDGFSLVEVLLVITIIGIFGSIAVISIGEIIEESKEKVCNVNTLELGKMYRIHLQVESVEHTEGRFVEFLYQNEEVVCPDNGDLSYVDGKVRCSLHSSEEGNGEDSDENKGSVPFRSYDSYNSSFLA